MRVKRGEMMRRVQVLKPGRSVFDLSYAKKMSGRIGYLYPMMCDEVVPGDVFEIGVDAVVRFAPMVAPVLHEINLKADWFFVPYRLLGLQADGIDKDGRSIWEKFITGGQDGNDPANRVNLGLINLNVESIPEGSLGDHLGFPTGVQTATANGNDLPLAFPYQAYYFIWNEYYRDPNLEDVFNYKSTFNPNWPLKYSNWDADYFTRALPFQQRGTPPALPVSGMTSAVWEDADFYQGTFASQVGPTFDNNNVDARMGVNGATGKNNAKNWLNSNSVDLSSATTFNVSDLRLAVQIQKWMERNSRSGARYTEFLRSHFGVAPRDDRLDRPEYIGGIRQPIQVSEVLQTSQNGTTPQGNLAGHGIMAGSHYVGKYHVQEYGLIMCLMSIQPRPAYQQGINRQWLRKTKYDFYHPEFANLSEQGIYNEEIYLQASEAANQTIWGYQGRYDEMRVKHDQVAGAFRSSLDYWHLGRKFGSLPALNSSFGHVDPATVTRIFAVPSADHLYVHWGNRIKAIRPLPYQSNPGLMDHDFGGY